MGCDLLESGLSMLFGCHQRISIGDFSASVSSFVYHLRGISPKTCKQVLLHRVIVIDSIKVLGSFGEHMNVTEDCFAA